MQRALMNRPQETEKKKPYEPPKLIVYGNLTEMTLTSGTRGKSDHGVKPGHFATG
jgi:hypothetical protein